MQTAQLAHLVPQLAANGSLAPLLEPVLKALIHSRAFSSQTKYDNHLRGYFAFCSLHKLSAVPADLRTVVFYFGSLLQRAEAKNQTVSVLTGPRDAISTLHQLCGYESPTQHFLIKQLLQGAQRLLKTPKRKRSPLTLRHLTELASRFSGPSVSLQKHMLVTAMSIGFFGFFRYSDLAAITANHVSMSQRKITIFLPYSKTDQLHRGASISFSACPGKLYCPVSLLTQLFARAGLRGTRRPVFMRFDHSLPTEIAIDYNRCHKQFKELFHAIGLDDTYGTHSLRVGGATLAASINIAEAQWMAHGRWLSTSAARGYVHQIASAEHVPTALAAAEAEEPSIDPSPNPLLAEPMVPLLPPVVARRRYRRATPTPRSVPTVIHRPGRRPITISSRLLD